jgi:type II secretory pathway pseudopilin PulG
MNTKTQHGYSLIEMMIALTTTLIVAGASFALMRSSIRFANSTYNVTEAEQSLRSSHEVINRDLTLAGDGLKGIGQITAPTAFVQNYITRTPVPSNDSGYPCVGLVTSDDAIPSNTAIPQANPTANFLGNSDRISMIVRDTTFNSGNSVSVLVGKLTISGSNTNIVMGSTAEINLFRVGEVYALVSQSRAAFFVVSGINTATRTLTITNGDGFGLNANGSNSPIYLTAGVSSGASTVAASIMRLQIIQYFLTDQNLLMRRVFGVANASFMDTAVAEHVTILQFRYMTNLQDTNGFARQPINNITTSLELAGVRLIETTVGVETIRAVNTVTNANTNSTVCGANPNGKQNLCTTTSTSVRNLQFRTALSP